MPAFNKLSRPPKDLESYLGRKWLEALTRQDTDLFAFTNLGFLLAAASALAPNARVLAVSSNLTKTDNGAGTTIVLDLSNTAVSPGTYNSVTVDSKGRVTAGTVEPGITDVENLDNTITVLIIGTTARVSLNLNKANTWLQDQSVPDEAYGVSWNGSLEVPTKNALYDKIETISGGGASLSDYTNTFLLGGM